MCLNYTLKLTLSCFFFLLLFWFSVGPIWAQVRLSTQKHRPEPGWAGTCGSEWASIHGQGGRRGYGDHWDGEPVSCYHTPNLSWASAHVSGPQTRYIWKKRTRMALFTSTSCVRVNPWWVEHLKLRLAFALEPFVWNLEPTKEELAQKLNTATRSMEHMNGLLHETEATNAVLMEQITVCTHKRTHTLQSALVGSTFTSPHVYLEKNIRNRDKMFDIKCKISILFI